MSAKSNTLDQVMRWIHNDGAALVQDDFWKNAADRISADVWNLDASAPAWDEAHAMANPSLWFYACLREGRIWAEDDAGMSSAEAGYQAALVLANGQVKQGVLADQVVRPYPEASSAAQLAPLELEQQPRGPDEVLTFPADGA